MLRTITRFTLAAGLALCLGLAFMPVGCGGSRGADAGAQGGDGLNIPDATVSELRACANQGRDRPKETEYALHFAVEVTEDGHVDRVKRRESNPADRGMESCMAGAIEGMRVSPSVMRALIPQAEATVSPQSRALLGNPLAAVMVVVELAPIVLVAAGATVVVGVAIYASEEVIETVKRRKKKDKIKEKCLVMYVDCTNKPPPCTTPRDFSYYLCSRCRDNCANESPYYTSECLQCGFE